AQLVVVTNAEGGGQGESARPDSLEAGFLDDAGGEPIVGLHHEGHVGTSHQAAELSGVTHAWILPPPRAMIKPLRRGPLTGGHPMPLRRAPRAALPIRYASFVSLPPHSRHEGALQHDL